MEEPLSLTLLYSANIAGDLAMLPRYFTFLQSIRPAKRQGMLLLDLGGSCADSVWHCRATGGRSALIVLDGMGYHAANVEGELDKESHVKLREQVTMALVDAARDWTYNVPPVHDPDVIVTLRPQDRAARLQIVLAPAAETRLDGKVLRLGRVCAGQVGEAVVDLRGAPRTVSAAIHTMPADTPPNPSIAGAVDFVLSEARLYQKNRRGQQL